jgi:hypothetical protein
MAWARKYQFQRLYSFGAWYLYGRIVRFRGFKIAGNSSGAALQELVDVHTLSFQAVRGIGLVLATFALAHGCAARGGLCGESREKYR